MYAIAIDGPASSGKSSMAKKVAERLNILHLNTGQLYRAIGLYAFQQGYFSKLKEDGTVIAEKSEIDAVVKNAKIEVKFLDGKQHTYLNGDDVTDLLHTKTASDYSSRVSVVHEIRDYMSQIQRDIASKHNVVMEGRDITSHILPNAKYKFFVTASPEVRAERRLQEMLEKGLTYTYEDILQDIIQRDHRDLTRDYCPLIVVPDAIVLDTSNKDSTIILFILLFFFKYSTTCSSCVKFVGSIFIFSSFV